MFINKIVVATAFAFAGLTTSAAAQDATKNPDVWIVSAPAAMVANYTAGNYIDRDFNARLRTAGFLVSADATLGDLKNEVPIVVFSQ